MSKKTEAKLILDYEFLTAKIVELGSNYTPPNNIAELGKMQAKLAETSAMRTDQKTADAEEETERNTREDLMKETLPIFAETITYGKSLFLDQNDLDALSAVNRAIMGRRSGVIVPKVSDAGKGEEKARTRSVGRTSYASRADKAAEFVELLRANPHYKATDDKFRLETFETRVAALQTANSMIAQRQATAQNLRTALDHLLYLDADCLVNSANSARNYIKSRFTTSHPIWNQIKNLKFDLPTRLRTKNKR